MTQRGEARQSRRQGREALLSDILSYSDKITTAIGGRLQQDVVDDDVLYDAILHRLMIVSEATTQLLACAPNIQERHPQLPWAQIRGIGNVLRHAYEFVEPDVVWATIHDGDLADVR